MRLFLSLVASIALLTAPTIQAQSLLDRSPNVSGDWTGSPGTLYFNFIHRFSTSGEPERKVTNVPTFFLGAGLPKHFLAGVNYSTNSTLAARYPNEWEAFVRWLPFSQDFGAPLDIGGQIGYNNAAQGVDGEVSLARSLGIARFIIAGRTLSDPTGGDNRRYAIAGAAIIRLGTYVSLTGDLASMNNRDTSERVAWSAGLHFAIPLTPHTVSLQATNTLVNTLQGASRGTSTVRYGFEFTIPLTLRRYFGRRAEQKPESDSSGLAAQAQVDSMPPPTAATPVKPDSVAPVSPAKPATTVSPPAVTPTAPAPSGLTPRAPVPAAATVLIVRTGMKNINYLRSKLEVVVGTTVEWTNHDPLPHSVTAVDRSFNSGLIQPGKTYRHTFSKVGTFNFFCMPHPFMKGTIVVRGQ
jgi:plastocyanin